jgi:beta-glucosidase
VIRTTRFGPAQASTLHEWLADERARGLLLAQGPTPKLLSDPELVRIIGTMPMDTLTAFGGMGFDHTTMQRLVDQLSAQKER